jgi:hypothetical protein
MGEPILNFNEKEYTDDFIKSHYDETFHNNHWNIFRPRNLNAAKIIYDTLKFKSVVDFGCSIGTYLEHFMNNNCEVKGFEYCYDECLPSIKNVTGLENFIEFGDVTVDIKLDKKYELSMSIEVAEHIPTTKSDIFVDNLCNSSSKYIFFTAAKPGQGGTGHINCQEKTFWIEKFNRRGWVQDTETENLIRNQMVSKYENDGDNTFPIVWSFVYENFMCFKYDRD